MPVVILLSKDMFFFPAVRELAERHASTALLSKTREDAIELAQSADKLAAVLIDLSAVSLPEFAQVHQELREAAPDAVLAAYGPHVHQPRLDAAAQAGFEPVLSKGMLHQRLEQLMADWLG